MQKSSVNRVVLIGYLGNDPESRYTPSGTAVTRFTLATNEIRKNKAGESYDWTEWHKVILFGNTAEAAADQLHKGSMAYLDGRVRTRSWNDQSGIRRYITEVLADKFTVLGNTPDLAASPPEVSSTTDEDELPY